MQRMSVLDLKAFIILIFFLWMMSSNWNEIQHGYLGLAQMLSLLKMKKYGISSSDLTVVNVEYLHTRSPLIL